MKARVKFNNEIIDVLQVGTKTHLYDIEDIEFLDNPQDYWERLKHQYAGMAMQGLLSNQSMLREISRAFPDEVFEKVVAEEALDYATALVEKLKSESNEN